MFCVCCLYSPLSLPLSISRCWFSSGSLVGTVAPPHVKQDFSVWPGGAAHSPPSLQRSPAEPPCCSAPRPSPARILKETITFGSLALCITNCTFDHACMERKQDVCDCDLHLGVLVLEPPLCLPGFQADLCAERTLCRLIWVVILLVCTTQHKIDIKSRALKHCRAQHKTDIKSIGLKISSLQWWFRPGLKASFSPRSWLNPGLKVSDVYILSHLLPPLHHSIYNLRPSHRAAPHLFAVPQTICHHPRA
jgi:hypothetical protein